MKTKKLYVSMLACLLLCAVALTAPRGGMFSSGNGDFDAGFWQEIFYGGGEGQPGNVISATGAEWSLNGATLESHEWVMQTATMHVHKTIYTGGQLLLDAGGPWVTAGDTLPYEVTLGDLVVITTKKFINDQLIELSWIMSATGSFDDYDDRTIEIRTSYTGFPVLIEQDGYPGMTDMIGTAEVDITLFADIDIAPDTLNLKSKGQWITCYIQLPDDVDVADIDESSIYLDDVVAAAWSDLQDDDTLMVKFPRNEVQALLEPGNVELTVTGELIGGAQFVGSDIIRVIKKGKMTQKNNRNKNKIKIKKKKK